MSADTPENLKIQLGLYPDTFLIWSFLQRGCGVLLDIPQPTAIAMKRRGVDLKDGKMRKALMYVKEGKKPAQAAKLADVPRSTLLR